MAHLVERGARLAAELEEEKRAAAREIVTRRLVGW
jgi:hypothetical protein